jgi:hypothetical protein
MDCLHYTIETALDLHKAPREDAIMMEDSRADVGTVDCPFANVT